MDNTPYTLNSGDLAFNDLLDSYLGIITMYYKLVGEWEAVCTKTTQQLADGENVNTPLETHQNMDRVSCESGLLIAGQPPNIHLLEPNLEPPYKNRLKLTLHGEWLGLESVQSPH